MFAGKIRGKILDKFIIYLSGGEKIDESKRTAQSRSLSSNRTPNYYGDPHASDNFIENILERTQNKKLALTVPRDNSTKKLEVKLSNLWEKINLKRDKANEEFERNVI